MPRHAWAAGLAIGPLFAWLCWAIQRRRYGSMMAAAFANTLLWGAGPAFVASALT